MYIRSTRNGIEIVLNNQTVIILLLLVKTGGGIYMLSFNRILQCMQIPLIVCYPGMRICLMGRLTDVSWLSHSYLGFMFVLGFMFATHDMILCGMTWQTNLIMFSCDSSSHRTQGYVELWVHLEI